MPNGLTFTPVRSPDAPLQRQVSYKLLEVAFGDSYTQRSPAGLNSTQQNFTVEWTGLSKEQADLIENFFLARGGYEWFYYTVPFVDSTASKKWICKSHSRAAVSPWLSNISADFTQVFDI